MDFASTSMRMKADFDAATVDKYDSGGDQSLDLGF